MKNGAALLAGFLLASSFTAFAGDATWVANTSANWSAGANWSPANAPGAISGTNSPDTATFANLTGVTVTIDQPTQNIGNIVFAAGAGADTIGNTGGNPLLLSSGGAILRGPTTSSEVIQAPLILEPANATSAASYTIADLTSTRTAGVTLAGPTLKGGTTTGTITLNLTTGPLGNVTVYTAISNGSAASVGVTTANVWVNSGTNGIIELGGANTYTGPTAVSSGSCYLFGSVSSSSTLQLNNNAYFLYYVVGQTTSQTLAGTTINPGQSTVVTGSSNNQLHLGAITHQTGGMVQFSNQIPGTIYTTSSNTNSILGPWALYGSGSSIAFAAANGSTSPITNMTFGTAATSGSLGNMTNPASNYGYSGSTSVFLPYSVTGNTLTLTTANVLVFTEGHTLTLNGLLNNGNGDFTIYSDGSVAIGATNELDIFTATGNIYIESPITGNGALAYGSVTTGTTNLLTLSGNNTYTGGTYINGGVLSAASSGALASTGTIFFDGGILQFSAGNNTDYSGRFSTAPNQLFSFDTNGQVVPLSANLASGGCSLAVKDLASTGNYGRLVLTGANTFANGIFLEQIGTLTLGSSGALGSTGAIHFDGGKLQFTAANTTDYSSRFSQAPAQQYTLDTNGQAVTLAANLVSANGSLTKSGAGVLTVTGANSFAGNVYLSGGSVNVASAGALGSSGTIYFFGGALQYSAANTTDYSSRFSNQAGQAWSIDTNGQSVTLATAFTSTGGSLTKSGAGTLSLSENNTYTGATSAQGGTLTLASSQTATSSISTAAGATLNLASGSFRTSGAITNGGTLVLGPAVALSSTGSFINNGTLDLRNDPSYFLPANFVNNGTVLLSNGGTLSAAVASDTPTLPMWALAILAIALVIAGSRPRRASRISLRA